MIVSALECRHFFCRAGLGMRVKRSWIFNLVPQPILVQCGVKHMSVQATVKSPCISPLEITPTLCVQAQSGEVNTCLLFQNSAHAHVYVQACQQYLYMCSSESPRYPILTAVLLDVFRGRFSQPEHCFPIRYPILTAVLMDVFRGRFSQPEHCFPIRYPILTAVLMDVFRGRFSQPEHCFPIRYPILTAVLLNVFRGRFSQPEHCFPIRYPILTAVLLDVFRGRFSQPEHCFPIRYPILTAVLMDVFRGRFSQPEHCFPIRYPILTAVLLDVFRVAFPHQNTVSGSLKWGYCIYSVHAQLKNEMDAVIEQGKNFNFYIPGIRLVPK